MKIKPTKLSPLFDWILCVVFFIFSFFFIWLVLKPNLIYQAQEPVFFLDSHFFREFLDAPGGLIAWASAGLTSVFIFPLPGALCLTGILIGISWLTHRWLSKLRETSPSPVVALLPAILNLGLFCHYSFPIQLPLALLINLTALTITLSLFENKAGFQGLLACLLFHALYLVTGGAVLLFALLFALSVWIGRKSLLEKFFSGFLLILAAGLPALAAFRLFMITPRQAYLTNLWIDMNFRPGWLLTAVLAILPLLILLPGLVQLTRRLFPRFRISIPTLFQATLKLLLVALCTAGLLLTAHNIQAKTLYRLNWEARNNNWKNLLRYVDSNPSDHILAHHLTSHALFETGILLDSLFAYPQPWGEDGLFLNEKFNYAAPAHTVDFCLSLGLLNSAEHWAHEAVTLEGETPWILYQLALINLAKNETDFAETCLRKLKKTPFSTVLTDSESDQFGDLIALAGKRAPETDFILSRTNFAGDLRALAKLVPDNKMAFEYRMALELFNKNLDAFVEELPTARALGYKVLPVHWQEALLLGLIQSRDNRPDMLGYRFHPSTMERLDSFQKIMSTGRFDMDKARSRLIETFGKSYWTYFMFAPNPEAPEQAEETGQ